MKKLHIDKIDLTWEYIKMMQSIRVVSALRVTGAHFRCFFYFFIIPFCRDYIHKYITSMSRLTL